MGDSRWNRRYDQMGLSSWFIATGMSREIPLTQASCREYGLKSSSFTFSGVKAELGTLRTPSKNGMQNWVNNNERHANLMWTWHNQVKLEASFPFMIFNKLSSWFFYPSKLQMTITIKSNQFNKLENLVKVLLLFSMRNFFVRN